MVSTVEVLFLAVAAFTDLKRPVLASRPIFQLFGILITPFPGRTGPAVRRGPDRGDEAVPSKT